jgi:hypothetical protein
MDEINSKRTLIKQLRTGHDATRNPASAPRATTRTESSVSTPLAVGRGRA